MPDFYADPVAADLAKVGPHGYEHGWRYVGGPGLPPPRTPYAGSTKPGSFEHLNAIEDLGRQAAASPGDPGHASPTMAAALHNMARAVARRDMDSARIHLAAARSANRTEAGGKWSHELNDLSHQLGNVPGHATGWENRQELNPLFPEAQHPGTYLPTSDIVPGGVPANPTAGAMQEYMSEPTGLRRKQTALPPATGSVADFAHSYNAIVDRMRATGETGEVASREVMAGKLFADPVTERLNLALTAGTG